MSWTLPRGARAPLVTSAVIALNLGLGTSHAAATGQADLRSGGVFTMSNDRTSNAVAAFVRKGGQLRKVGHFRPGEPAAGALRTRRTASSWEALRARRRPTT
jgi:hypothetical protein